MSVGLKPKPGKTINYPKPVCPTHGCVMHVGCVRGSVRYWYCTVQDCSESKQTMREKESGEKE